MKSSKANGKNDKGREWLRNMSLWGWYVFFAMAFFIPLFLSSAYHPKEITWQEFENDILSKKAVEKIVVVNGEYAEIYIRKEFNKDPYFKDVFPTRFTLVANMDPQYKVSFGSVDTFDRKLEDAEKLLFKKEIIPVQYIKRSNWIGDILSWLLPVIILIVLWNYLFRKVNPGNTGTGSVFSFGKSTATLFDKTNKSTVTFDDVAGLDEAQLEVHEIVDFLKNSESFTRLGAKIPKGVLLIGPPGTGKTLLAKAVAGEAKVPFFSISGSEFVEMFVGVGASRVRDLFKTAKEKAPCIIFIDEIDAIGRSRSRNTLITGANDERESTLNQLLTEMDGFGSNSGVIVLAATNRADMLDPALLRPGRFDRLIYLELPNQQEREAIFKVHLKPIVTDHSINIHFLAVQTAGFSGADIANICNESALIAARKKNNKVSRQDFLDAIDRTIAGQEKKSKIISPEEKQIIAFHEAGHALVSWVLKTVDALLKVSIIPRGKSLGAAWYLPEERQLRSRTAFREHLCATLAGRAAEQNTFNEISSGALDDLEKATKEAYMMVAYYGFDEKIGAVSFYDSTGQRDTGFQKPYSEETGKLIDEEVRNLVGVEYEHARRILKSYKAELDQIANLLLQKEVIFKEDLEKVLGDRNLIKQIGTVNAGHQNSLD